MTARTVARRNSAHTLASIQAARRFADLNREERRQTICSPCDGSLIKSKGVPFVRSFSFIDDQ